MPREGNRGFEIRERVARGIRNLGKFSLWNPESWALDSKIHRPIEYLP